MSILESYGKDDSDFFIIDPVVERREKNYKRTDKEAMILKKLEKDWDILGDHKEIMKAYYKAMKELGLEDTWDMERKLIEFDGEDPDVIAFFEETHGKKYYRVKTHLTPKH